MRRFMQLARVVPAAALCLCCLSPGSSLAAPASNPGNEDPLEPMNRRVFWFNDQLDNYVLEPVATGWDTIAPDRVEDSVANFFRNLRFPIVAGNNLLQGKFRHAASDVGRFTVNTTVGVLGFFDPASDWGLEQHNEDFGQTLGYWGVPAGPYLVLPIFGPSSPRDTVGLAADSFSTVYPFFVDIAVSLAAPTADIINTRALALGTVREVKQASLDYYVAVRNAYLQRRDALVHDRTRMTEEEENELYQFHENGGE